MQPDTAVNEAAARAPHDIASIDAVALSEEGMTVSIINPRTLEPLGLEIQVQGAYSTRFQELLARKRRTEELRGKNPLLSRAVSAADEQAETADLLAEITLGWRNMVEHGKPVAFTKPEARRVYLAYPIIRGQVFDAVLNAANFVKA